MHIKDPAWNGILMPVALQNTEWLMLFGTPWSDSTKRVKLIAFSPTILSRRIPKGIGFSAHFRNVLQKTRRQYLGAG